MGGGQIENVEERKTERLGDREREERPTLGRR